jgi:hypothetical protein
VQGRNTAPLESLTDLPLTVARLDYLRDLDAAGLAIAIAGCAAAQRAGVVGAENLVNVMRPGGIR